LANASWWVIASNAYNNTSQNKIQKTQSCSVHSLTERQSQEIFLLKVMKKERERETLQKKMNHVFDQTKVEKFKSQQSSKFTTFISISYMHPLTIDVPPFLHSNFS
jgi:hypothetical protein